MQHIPEIPGHPPPGHAAYPAKLPPAARPFDGSVPKVASDFLLRCPDFKVIASGNFKLKSKAQTKYIYCKGSDMRICQFQLHATGG